MTLGRFDCKAWGGPNKTTATQLHVTSNTHLFTTIIFVT